MTPFTRSRSSNFVAARDRACGRHRCSARQDDAEEQAALNELTARLDSSSGIFDRSDKDVQKGSATKQQKQQLKLPDQKMLNSRITAQKTDRRPGAQVAHRRHGAGRDGEIGEALAPPTCFSGWGRHAHAVRNGRD